MSWRRYEYTGDRTSRALHAAKFGIALASAVCALEAFHATNLLSRLFGQVVFPHLLRQWRVDRTCVLDSFTSVRASMPCGALRRRAFQSALHWAMTSATDFRSALTSRFFQILICKRCNPVVRPIDHNIQLLF